MAAPINTASFGGTITLRRPKPAETPATDLPDPEPLRDEIRLGELDQVLEDAVRAWRPDLECNVVTTHLDK